MSCRQAFDLFEVVAMSRFVNPRIHHLHFDILRAGLLLQVFCALMEGFKIWVILARKRVMRLLVGRILHWR